MPAVKSIRAIADGFEIVTTAQGTKALTRATIPANVLSQPDASVEAWVNAWLATNISGIQAVVHITQLTPTLIAQVLCANVGVVIEPNWWAVRVTPR